MDELLQKLLEADILSSEVKTELEEAFKTKMNEALEAAKEQAANEVRAELTEQYIEEREQLIEALDQKIDDMLDSELAELREDVERFRDLEAEYAEKLIEEKAALRDELKNDLTEIVNKLDTFLEMRLTAELDELKDELQEASKKDFGRRIFEAFVDEYMNNYVDEESAELTLREAKQRLQDTQEALIEAEAKAAELERKIKMEQVLMPLSGKQREIMEAILRNVDTDNLEEGYQTFIGRVIREADDSEKEGEVLDDKADEDDEDDDKSDSKIDKDTKDKDSDKDSNKDSLDERLKNGVRMTGNRKMVTESKKTTEANDRLAHIRKLAGIQ